MYTATGFSTTLQSNIQQLLHKENIVMTRDNSSLLGYATGIVLCL